MGQQDGSRARDELGIDVDALVVAWHGRVDLHRKGLDVLVDAWWQLREAFRDREIRLLLVGAGSDSEGLRRRVAEAALEGVHLVDEYVLDRRRLNGISRPPMSTSLPRATKGFPSQSSSQWPALSPLSLPTRPE